MVNDFLQNMIADYESDLLGNRYTLYLSNSDVVSFAVEKKDVPHLLGIRKLPLRQVQNKSALAIYEMLKDGRIKISHKEEYIMAVFRVEKNKNYTIRGCCALFS